MSGVLGAAHESHLSALDIPRHLRLSSSRRQQVRQHMSDCQAGCGDRTRAELLEKINAASEVNLPKEEPFSFCNIAVPAVNARLGRFPRPDHGEYRINESVNLRWHHCSRPIIQVFDRLRT